jgi:hypothetical protein
MMSSPHLTREQLQTGAKVRVLGPYPPRDPKNVIEGTIKTWQESRFGGVFVEIEARTSYAQLHNSHCQCAECRKDSKHNERKMVLTYAMTDLVLA